ncbi:MAG: glycoside hydrolase family 3 protein [Treponema sp.]|nr:glycoside hydrolase family 3 protein [Treponema sp.]
MNIKQREDEIDSLINEMTIEEKVSQLLHSSMAIPRLGIHEYNWWNECLHGVARCGNATVFPQAIGLAATFNTELAQKEADAISTEARANYNESQKANINVQYRGLTFWTPNINIVRDPRWGRAQETYGEDPYLTSKMGIAFVKGLQGDDNDNLKVAACAKHFAVHSCPEKDRHTFNAKPSKKDLWETYLPAFKALVDAGVESVMGAYQRLYDEPCCGSKLLLVDILRKKWEFKGHVVSDCWAIRDFHENHKVTKTTAESAALAITNTCDLNCGCTYHDAVEAIHKNLLSEESVNESLARLLRTKFKLGLFDDYKKSKWGNLDKKDINTPQNRELALKVAEESIVLLKNKNSLLPIKDEKKKILVIGPTATNIGSLMGNYYGFNAKLVTILEGIIGKIADMPNITLDYHPGCGMYNKSKQEGWTLGMAENADVVIACFGLDNMMEGEEGDSIETTKGDRDFIELPPHQEEYLRKLHQRGTPIVLILSGGAAIAFPEDLADAVLYTWYPGEEGGTAVANVLFGKTNPSGHLPVTFPKRTSDLPDFSDYSMKDRTYRYITKEPLYPFGFGLNYSKFAFSDLQTKIVNNKASSLQDSDNICDISLKVSNTGDFDGKEVVQVYISKNKKTNNEPLYTLRKYFKIDIESKKEKTISFNLKKEDFFSINDDGEQVLYQGDYTIFIAESSPSELSTRLGAISPLIETITIQ